MDYYSSLRALASDNLECHFFDSLESTSTFLSDLPFSPATQLCIAREQTQGKGQHGREWASLRDGSILFSIRQVFNNKTNLNGLSLLVGIAIIKALEIECQNKEFKIKWPNDIYLRKHKLAGILLENQLHKGSHSVVIGVGVNYHLHEKISSNTSWIDLKSLDKKLPEIQQMTASIIDSVLKIIEQFKLYGLSNLLSQWDQYDMLKGTKIMSTEVGKSFEGEVIGISDLGALKVLTKNGIKELYSSKHIEYI